MVTGRGVMTSAAGRSQEIGEAADVPAKVTVGHDAGEVAVGVDDTRHAELLA